MTINDNSTKSINAAIIDLQNQIKQLQNKIGILSKNQLKEDDIEFPGKVEYADEAGKAKEADHAKTADTAKYTSETENAVHAGYADIATKATQDGSGNVITDTYATKTELTSGLSGKANTSHNHSAADITSGTLPVERGGTGQTTQVDINKAFVGGLEEGTSDVTDGTMFVSSYASDNGFDDTNAVNVPYKRKFSRVWEYIKGKISSVLGLTATAYGGKASTAGTADIAKGMDHYTIDLSAQSMDNFYPLFFYTAANFVEVAIKSNQEFDSFPYNQNRIHFDISTHGWTDTPRTLNIREYACFRTYEITIGCIGIGVQDGGWAIWLRGGLAYEVFTRNAVPTLMTNDYTFLNETYTVGTNYYGGVNNNVDIIFTPQSTITDGIYTSRSIKSADYITAPNITALENRVAALESKVQ